jgi:hypothetical protein
MITALSLIYTHYNSPLHAHAHARARTHTHTTLTLSLSLSLSLVFSVFTSRILAMDFITVSLSRQITHEAFFAAPNCFLAIILQLPTQFNSSASKLISRQAGVSKLDSLFSAEPLFIIILHGRRRKHNLSIVGKVCLQRRYV